MVVVKEKCYICGNKSEYRIEDDATLLRDATCSNCGAGLRNSDIAKMIVRALLDKDASINECLYDFNRFKIIEAATCGHLHELLKKTVGYIGFEYMSDVLPGEYKNGALCNDLQNLSFEDSSLDLIITQDVLEHVENPEKAFEEINRVLKAGGYHIFTVPLHEGRLSLDRTGLNKVYHCDYLREEGSLVYTDWGEDIKEIIDKHGMKTEIKKEHIFYSPTEITNVDITYKDYKNLESIRYYKYNSNVIVSKKIDIREDYNMGTSNFIEWTGERYIPWASLSSPDIDYEHLSRYFFALQFVKGKKALDLASGEGYGTAILAMCAEEVVGIDIDEMAIKHANNKYIRNNIQYKVGSISDIQIDGEKIFDVITCFEALEHIKDQDKLLSEIKRLLKDDGLILISSPNKHLYTDEMKNDNPYHLKELYFDEFSELISSSFINVKFLGQRVLSGSVIWPLGVNIGKSELHSIEKRVDHFEEVKNVDMIPLYFIAIASNTNLPDHAYFSNTFDISEEVKSCFLRTINSLQNKSSMQIDERDHLIMQIAEMEKTHEETKLILSEQRNEIAKVTNAMNDIIAGKDRVEQAKRIEIDKLKASIEKLKIEVSEKDKHISEIYNSHSWKSTALIRKISKLIKNDNT